MPLTRLQALAVRLRSLLLAGGASAGSHGESPASRRAPAASHASHASHASVADVVQWFGAMQAQDLASGLWSLGLRLPDLTRADVQDALERREALRTWPMRGTVHLVPPRDAHWMLDLMGVRALAGAAKRRESLGLEQSVAEHAVDLLGEALAGGKRLTRAQCVEVLERGGISGAGQRAYHLLWYASQRGVTCIAPNVGTEQTFVLLDDWVPDPVRLDRDEALRTVALRYVRSHGPATRADLAGWTGLPLREVDRGVELSGGQVARVDVDGVPMLVAAAALDDVPNRPDARVRVLPGFDEYLLGVKDRSLVLDPEHFAAVVPGGNGVFQATVVRAGRVVGIWKRTTRAARTEVAVTPLAPLGDRDQRRVERAFEPYAAYLQTPVEVRWTA